jgi:molybdopterin converting factor small subunit
MRVRVRLFAVARQVAKRDTIEIEVGEGATVSDLRLAIGTKFPDLRQVVRHSMFAINADYTDDTTPIPGDADVACIPPVSGG